VSRARDWRNLSGKAAKIEKSPGKSAKAKRLSFAFICFLEAGLFSGLRPIQMKIFSPLFNSRRSCMNARTPDRRLTRPSEAERERKPALKPAIENQPSRNFWITQEFFL